MSLKKYSQVIGAPVIGADKQKKIGVVKDLFFRRSDRIVDTVLVEKNNYLSTEKILHFDDIDVFGEDAIIVNRSSCLKKPSKQDLKTKLNRTNMKGMQIFEKNGDELGIVSDILFNIETGIVEGLVVSNGLVQDIIKGRNTIVLIGREEFSSEYVLVEKESAEEMIKGNSILDLLKNEE